MDSPLPWDFTRVFVSMVGRYIFLLGFVAAYFQRLLLFVAGSLCHCQCRNHRFSFIGGQAS